MRLARRDSQLTPEQRSCLTQCYGDRTMELLQQAVARGYRDVDELEKATAYQPLRSCDDFQKLLVELKAPPKEPR